jgi:NADPH-dependent 7-cyano-7-deazaguanine reductase QueF
MIENTQYITAIEADKRISLYCPIGKDYYTADVTIKFVPNAYYMDYIELDQYLNRLSGLSLTIEEAAKDIYEELQKYYPAKAKVTIEAFSNTHLHVKVTKGDDI